MGKGITFTNRSLRFKVLAKESNITRNNYQALYPRAMIEIKTNKLNGTFLVISNITLKEEKKIKSETKQLIQKRPFSMSAVPIKKPLGIKTFTSKTNSTGPVSKPKTRPLSMNTLPIKKSQGIEGFTSKTNLTGPVSKPKTRPLSTSTLPINKPQAKEGLATKTNSAGLLSKPKPRPLSLNSHQKNSKQEKNQIVSPPPPAGTFITPKSSRHQPPNLETRPLPKIPDHALDKTSVCQNEWMIESGSYIKATHIDALRLKLDLMSKHPLTTFIFIEENTETKQFHVTVKKLEIPAKTRDLKKPLQAQVKSEVEPQNAPPSQTLYLDTSSSQPEINIKTLVNSINPQNTLISNANVDTKHKNSKFETLNLSHLGENVEPYWDWKNNPNLRSSISLKNPPQDEPDTDDENEDHHPDFPHKLERQVYSFNMPKPPSKGELVNSIYRENPNKLRWYHEEDLYLKAQSPVTNTADMIEVIKEPSVPSINIPSIEDFCPNKKRKIDDSYGFLDTKITKLVKQDKQETSTMSKPHAEQKILVRKLPPEKKIDPFDPALLARLWFNWANREIYFLLYLKKSLHGIGMQKGPFVVMHGNGPKSPKRKESIKLITTGDSKVESTPPLHNHIDPKIQSGLVLSAPPSIPTPPYTPWLLNVYCSEMFCAWQSQWLLFVLMSAAVLVMTSLVMNPVTLAAVSPLIAHMVLHLTPLAFNAILGIAIGSTTVFTGLLGLSLYGRFFAKKDACENLTQNNIYSVLGSSDHGGNEC